MQWCARVGEYVCGWGCARLCMGVFMDGYVHVCISVYVWVASGGGGC